LEASQIGGLRGQGSQHVGSNQAMARRRDYVAIDPTAFIHAKAHVEASTIGAGCRIYQFASVTRGTVLGERCTVWPFALLDGSRFGKRCKIASGVAVGAGFMFGDDCFVGPNVTFCNDLWPATHNDGFDCDLFRRGSWTVVVGNQVAIGANAVVLPGVTIGHRAMIAAGAVVSRNVEESHLYRRDGTSEPIRDGWMEKRMRFVCSTS
jgi:UDP-2-acetamido-3-amino-2,3-dideoxy-glucuronate N-acetyltransferase